MSTAIAAAVTASFAFSRSAFWSATPSSFHARFSNESASDTFFCSPCTAASGWARAFTQFSSVFSGMPSCFAVRFTLPAFAWTAATAAARSSSEYRRRRLGGFGFGFGFGMVVHQVYPVSP